MTNIFAGFAKCLARPASVGVMARGRAKAEQARGGGLVEVPGLLGLHVAKAFAAGLRAGLVVKVIEPEPEDRPVLRQRPAPGTFVERGSEVVAWTTGPGDGLVPA
ncbi:PASTA domain-containing protein [Amycolatopsis sacchari]|uniref:PASTA domain-containing protein n=2 Tax=Pseudonocardiaceae TaxID=2070 RepID=A0A1I3QX43_9PSEU|nr:PASTA domain-containing protein [Amycolatopsis sacchari]